MQIVPTPSSRWARCALAAASLAPAATSTAHAALIRVDFQLRVTFVQLLPIIGVSPALGDTVTGHFTYDTGALDQGPGDPTHGLYFSGSIQIDIGGLTLSSAAPARQDLYDVDGPSYLWSTWAGWLPGVNDDGGILVNGVFTPEVRMGLYFTQPAGGLTSDAQPSLSDLATLEVAQFNILQSVPDSLPDRVVQFDDVTTLSAYRVPAPATLPLVLAGLRVLAARRRRPVAGARRRRPASGGALASACSHAGRRDHDAWIPTKLPTTRTIA